jgi:DNA-binding MarR family transcriptional regulator
VTLEDEILSALRRIIRATDEHSRALLTRHGLTGPQWTALRVLVEDGCATVTPDRHEFTIATLKDRYTRVLVTDEAIAEISRHVETEPA